ncbi:Tol biopolymer transport system component [Kribbella aluminosa]|uniref:Tol biopolymer transport system component n=1 Tax=Kribbella aluminosa TaxID=416017 RepID=A0ABS4UK41_9ACTN|nr:amidohydrolase family protein [Kribbella aluminosa]MBP2351985.1 Tol biopolymer transport system component [Kribbella aluminosa]
MSGWDVTDTGQPTHEVSFSTNEGTWMSVSVSPDGQSIVFDLLGTLYAVPAAGGRATALRTGPTMDRMPVHSPDGTQLLYLSDADGYDNAWRCDADGSNHTQLTFETHDILTEPIWGPDSRSIVAPRIFRAHRKLFSSQIRLYEHGSGEGRLLVDVPASGRDVLEPALSPDGQWLYYAERLVRPNLYVDANHANFAIKRHRFADGRVETVAGGFGGAIRPCPSPDGRRLAFLRRVKEKTVLFCLELATGEQRPVFDGLDRDNQAVWEIQGNYYPRFSWFPGSTEVAIWAGGAILRVDVETGRATPIPFEATYRQTLTTPVRPRHDLAPAEVRVRAIRHLAFPPKAQTATLVALGRLWRSTLDDTAPVPIGDHARHAAEPAYSAEGDRVVYVEWDDERGSSLCLTDHETVDVVTTTTGVVRQPSFSPDSTKLVYRIQPHDVQLGGARIRPGVYVVEVAGGEPRYLTLADDAPSFGPGGDRVYAVATDSTAGEPAEVLFSVDLDGKDRREHARTADVDTYELRLSPDGRWLAFRSQHRYYLVPYRDTGHVMPVTPDTTETICFQIADHGGQALTWAPDSRTLHWCVGPAIYSLEIGTHGPVGEPRVAVVDLRVPADVPDGRIALVGGTVITMAGDLVHSPGTVVVEGNRIVAVGDTGSTEVPSGARVIDCAGKTLMPGLVDGHGHIDGAAGDGVTPQKQASRFAALAFGVTTNFDPFSSELPNYESAELTRAGLMTGPRWIGTGSAIHGRDHNFFHLHTPIAEYADAERIVGQKKQLGTISVKSYKWPERRHRQMLVKAAREHEVNIVVEGETHFYNNVSMVLDGHTNLEHNFPVATIYDDVVQLVKSSGVSSTPTLVVAFGELFGENWAYQHTEAWRDPRVRTFVQACLSGYSPLGTPYGAPPHARAMTTIHVADELYDIGVLAVSRSVKKLDDAGVRINAGSHGQLPGLAMHWEMALLAAGGMSPHRVLRAATLNTAESLGVGHQLGSLEPGKLADLLVLDRNPLDDIANSTSVTSTMVNGRLYDAATLNELAPRQRTRGRFYWETQNTLGIDWSEPWGGGTCH